MPLRDRFSSNSDLYSFLKDVVLKDYLGIYTYTINNVDTSIPSIYIVKDKDEDPPNEWERQPDPAHPLMGAIECLIFKPKIKPREYWMKNGIVTIYEFRLIQHDRSKDLTDVQTWITGEIPLAKQTSHLEPRADREEQITYSIAKANT